MTRQFQDISFCLLCGDMIFDSDWKSHMIEHGLVSENNPKNDEGEWIEKPKKLIKVGHLKEG